MIADEPMEEEDEELFQTSRDATLQDNVFTRLSQTGKVKLPFVTSTNSLT